jgi:hypothetical protein
MCPARLIAVLAFLLPSVAAAQSYSTTPLDTWGVNDDINAFERVSNRLFVAGDFTRVVPQTRGGFVAISAVTGEARGGFNPRLPSGVTAIASDGHGGWYVAGLFGTAGPGARLRRIRADGTTDPAFAPVVDGRIQTVAVAPDRLFIGGDFLSVGGTAVRAIAALDLETGVVANWRSDVTGYVFRLEYLPGGRLLVRGSFNTIGTATRRSGVAILDAITGSLLPWTVDSHFVWDFAVSGDRLYACGGFDSINGQVRQSLAEIDLTTADVLPWHPPRLHTLSSPSSCSIAVSSGRVYVMWDASGVKQAFALSRTTAALIPEWQPAVAGFSGSASMFVAFGRVYLRAAPHLPWTDTNAFLWAVDATTGALDSTFAPRPDNLVSAIAADGADLLIGGDFIGVQSVGRHGLLAIDLDTRTLVDWSPPDVLDRSQSLAVAGGRLFVHASADIHAFDLTTLQPVDWSLPDRTRGVVTIASAGDRVIVARADNTDPRLPPLGPGEALLILDPLTGERATAPLVASGSRVSVGPMGVSGNRVYFSGSFSGINGVERGGLAAVDVTSGVVLPWAPSPTRVDRIVAGPGFVVLDVSTFSGSLGLRVLDTERGEVLRDVTPPPSREWHILDVVGRLAALSDEAAVIGSGGDPILRLIDYTTGQVRWEVGGAFASTIPLFRVGPLLRIWDDYVVASGGTRLGSVAAGRLLIFPALRPDAPEQLQGSVAGRMVTLTWRLASTTPEPDTILIEVGTATGLRDIGTFAVAPSVQQVGGWLPPGTYFVRLRSRYQDATSSPSNEVTFTVGTLPSAPQSLSGSVGTSAGGSHAQLSWAPPSSGPVDGYIIEVGSIAGLANLGRFPVPASFTSVRVEQPPSGTYYVRVRAANTDGIGSPSNEIVLIVP